MVREDEGPGEAGRATAPARRDEREARRRVSLVAGRVRRRRRSRRSRSRRSRSSTASPTAAGPTSRSSSSTTGCAPTARPTRSPRPRSTRRRCSPRRMQDCIAKRGSSPTRSRSTSPPSGDLLQDGRTSSTRPIARQSGVTADHQRDHPAAARPGRAPTDDELNELRRLPKISEEKARRLLGPLADSSRPRALPSSPTRARRHDPRHRGDAKAAKNRKKRRASTTTSPTTSTTTTVATRLDRTTGVGSTRTRRLPRSSPRAASPSLVTRGALDSSALQRSRSVAAVVRSSARAYAAASSSGRGGAAGRRASRAGTGSRRAWCRSSASTSTSPASGPSAIATATARLSSTTGEPVIRTSSP